MITRTGLAVGVSAATLLLAGTLTDYPELVMLGLAGVSALVVAAVWMLARPRLTAVREIRPGRVPEGSPAWGAVTVTNTGRRRSPPLVVTETIADRHVTVPLPSLAVGKRHETVYPLPTGRRGRHVIPAFVIGHSDPLRLLRAGRAGGGESILYVHPRVHHVVPVPVGGPRDLEGPTSSSSPQGGVAFHSLRGYEPGDDWRLIHWKSTARSGTLMVRHNVIPDEPRHLIVLDTSAESYTDRSFEDAVRIAASLCVAADRSGFPLDLRTTVGTAGTAREAVSALDLLATAECSAADRGLSTLIELLRDVLAGDEGVALCVVTGQADPERLEVLTSLRQRFLTVSLVQVGEPSPWYAATPPGVITINSPTSEQFATVWNQLVLP